jgi:hypothetical protein
MPDLDLYGVAQERADVEFEALIRKFGSTGHS